MVLLDKDSKREPLLSPTSVAHSAHMALMLHSLLSARLSRCTKVLNKHCRPHRRHHYQLGLLAPRLAYVLVCACHNAAIYVGSLVYEADRASCHISLVAVADGSMVCHGAVGAAYTSCGGTLGDIWHDALSASYTKEPTYIAALWQAHTRT